MPHAATASKPDDIGLVSATGVLLSRATAFKFTLDVNREQHARLMSHAGAARLAFNHHVARVKANLDQRAAERTYGIEEADLTPSLSWSKFSFINEMNAWKDSRAADSRVNDDGTRGLAWRGEVSADVFETASVNAATALKNWTDSRTGKRAGKAAGFPRFKSKHRNTPAFRLRSKSKPGATAPVRATGAKVFKFPKLGELRVRENTGKLAKMMAAGRFHPQAASFRFEHGRWHVVITGVAAQFHGARRTKKERTERVGVDLGLTTFATVADENGRLLQATQGVKALQHAQERLRVANKALSRTKKGSNGRRKAATRLGKAHRRVAALRRQFLHALTTQLVRDNSTILIEDLNNAGLMKNHSLARHLADASFGEFRRMLTYKAGWFGTEVLVADRWFASSKTCSGCGAVATELALGDRVYQCGCGLELDRDLNAAINLARWTPTQKKKTSSPPRVAA